MKHPTIKRLQNISIAVAGAIIGIVLALLAGACGGGTPTSPSGNDSLTGLWRGNVVILKSQQAAQPGEMAWRLDGQGTNYTTRVTTTNTALSFPTTVVASTAITGSDYPYHYATQSAFECGPSRQGGAFSSVGTVADRQTITGSFHGIDCDGRPYDGQVALSR